MKSKGLVVILKIGARPGSRCDTRPSKIITYKYHKTEAFPLAKCIHSTMCLQYIGYRNNCALCCIVLRYDIASY